MAKQIWTDYISRESKCKLAISEDVHKEIEEIISKGEPYNPYIFDKAEEQIYKAMIKGSLRKALHSFAFASLYRYLSRCQHIF